MGAEEREVWPVECRDSIFEDALFNQTMLLQRYAEKLITEGLDMDKLRLIAKINEITVENSRTW